MTLTIIKWTATTLLILLIVLGISLYQEDLPAAEIDARYSNSESEFLQLGNGNRIHFRDQGAGYPIVLIHGAMASLHTWEPWVQLLKHQYRIVTIDLPGHGLTGAVTTADYSADAFTETIHSVTQALQLKKFVLGGNSMGGGATWRYALAYPEQVSHMILVDSVAPRPHNSQAANAPAERSTSSPFAPLQWAWFRSIASHIDPRWLVARGLRSAYNHSPVVDDTLVDRYTDLILREGTRQAILARSTRNRRNTTSADLSSLAQPTLIIWGAQDALIPVATGKRLHQTLPNSELVIYDNLGHVPMEEDPSRTARDVLKFLSEHSVARIAESDGQIKRQ